MEQLSFSSQLNAPPNIKTIKEYEAENEQLKTENFQLMHQLSYYRNRGDADMQLVNKNDVESLELENAQLKKQISAMIEENNKRMKLDDERNQELLGYKVRERNYVARESEYKKAMENYKSIETEFMEKEKKYSKMISDIRAAEKNLNDQMKECNNMIEQLTMQNKVHVEKNNYLEKKLEDTMCVLEALREDNNDNITNLSKLNEQKKFYDNIISEQAEKIKNLEVNNNFLRNEVKNAGTASHLRDEENKRLLNENKHIKDLLEDERKRMSDNMNEMEGMKLRTEQNNRIELENTKRKAQQLASENTKLSSAISELENKQENIRNEYEKILKKYSVLKNEHAAAINKFKGESSDVDGYKQEIMRLNGIVFKQRMFFNSINELINHISLRVKNAESKVVKFQLNDKNKKMLGKLNIKPTIGINNLLRKLFKVIHGLRQENGALENERSDILSFVKENGANNRTIKLIEEFSKEFEDARNGLNECRAYLEKKGKENKLLKSEIRKLRKCSKSAL